MFLGYGLGVILWVAVNCFQLAAGLQVVKGELVKWEGWVEVVAVVP